MALARAVTFDGLSTDRIEQPWGAYQPKFERLVTDGENRYFLEGRLKSGEPVRVQLTTAGFRTRPGS